MIIFSREWAMPRKDTFAIKPISELLDRWLAGRRVILDPFARNGRRGTLRNDIDVTTSAEYHMDAVDFIENVSVSGILADAVLFDPPYSPRQISEHYKASGRSVSQEDTQSSFYSRAKDPLAEVVSIGGITISAGWNSVGFGKGRGFALREVLLVCHGGAHNDTIVVVEEKV